MDQLSRIPRKRVANFTPDEKALLAELIKKRPIIESKLTDGKSVVKKKAAWFKITEEFNFRSHVHRRDTITLKRAWDNMKAVTRKERATERSNSFRSGGDGPPDSPQSPKQGTIVPIVEEAAPGIKYEVNYSFDSNDTTLNGYSQTSPASSDLPLHNQHYLTEEKDSGISTQQSGSRIPQNTTHLYVDSIPNSLPIEPNHKLPDYIRREAVMRIKHLKAKNKIEIQILKAQLEAAEASKKASEANQRAAHLEEERSKTRLEVVKLELEKCRKQLD